MIVTAKSISDSYEIFDHCNNLFKSEANWSIRRRGHQIENRESVN
jgi:hypothetical protein